MNLLKTTVLLLLLICARADAQTITGVWRGRIASYRVELKLVQKGDSLTGTCYYITSSGTARYTVKGFFDPSDNSVVWWDESLVSQSSTRAGILPMLSRGDFNCPGGGKMLIDGKASREEKTAGPVALQKQSGPSIPDEWDFIIENYTAGTNDPELIDSVARIASVPPPPRPVIIPAAEKPAVIAEPVQPALAVVKPPVSIDEKFRTRKLELTTTIPLEGDSIELRFYDNAQVDGDSISLYLNGKRIFEHIRLTDKAYTIKLPTKDLQGQNELVMVAENLGSIPPNTSYMVALSGSKRYEAQLASTENSSAMIRLVRE